MHKLSTLPTCKQCCLVASHEHAPCCTRTVSNVVCRVADRTCFGPGFDRRPRHGSLRRRCAKTLRSTPASMAAASRCYLPLALEPAPLETWGSQGAGQPIQVSRTTPSMSPHSSKGFRRLSPRRRLECSGPGLDVRGGSSFAVERRRGVLTVGDRESVRCPRTGTTA